MGISAIISAPLQAFAGKLGTEGQALVGMVLTSADAWEKSLQADADAQIKAAEDRAQAMLTQVLDRVDSNRVEILAWAKAFAETHEVYAELHGGVRVKQPPPGAPA